MHFGPVKRLLLFLEKRLWIVRQASLGSGGVNVLLKFFFFLNVLMYAPSYVFILFFFFFSYLTTGVLSDLLLYCMLMYRTIYQPKPELTKCSFSKGKQTFLTEAFKDVQWSSGDSVRWGLMLLDGSLSYEPAITRHVSPLRCISRLL